jgi:hypothetical protein
VSTSRRAAARSRWSTIAAPRRVRFATLTRVSSIRFAALLVAATSLLAACAQPLPADRAAYAGDWNGPGTILSISQDGHLVLDQTTGGTKTSLKGPIKEFDGDDIVVGFAFVTSTIDVTAPPVEANGVWTMAVSGVELTRK